MLGIISLRYIPRTGIAKLKVIYFFLSLNIILPDYFPKDLNHSEMLLMMTDDDALGTIILKILC